MWRRGRPHPPGTGRGGRPRFAGPLFVGMLESVCRYPAGTLFFNSTTQKAVRGGYGPFLKIPSGNRPYMPARILARESPALGIIA